MPPALKKRNLRSHPDQQTLLRFGCGYNSFARTNMRTNMFDANSVKSPSTSDINLRPDTPLFSPFNDDDYSGNVLNMAFIADESHLPSSDSQSVVSDNFSISAISMIRGNSNDANYMRLEEEFSCMQEWPVQQKISFAKSNLKRMNPSIEQEECEDELGNRCTKRKMNEKMRVVTINPMAKKEKIGEKNEGYMLRSRFKAKMADCSDSSDDSLLQIISQIDDSKKSSIRGSSKPNPK